MMTNKKNKDMDETVQKIQEFERLFRESLPPVIQTYVGVDGCLRFAPKLAPVYLMLQPFADVIHGYTFGPQPQARDYDASAPQYMRLRISDPRYPGSDTEGQSVEVTISENEIQIDMYFMSDDEDQCWRETDHTNMTGLLDYLRQIPRPYTSFLRGKK